MLFVFEPLAERSHENCQFKVNCYNLQYVYRE